MIRKNGYRFSEKIMLEQNARAADRFAQAAQAALLLL